MLFVAEIPDGDAVYLFDGLLTELAKEGDPSPVAGRNWQTLGTSSVALNNSGSYAVLGQLEGDTNSNALIIRDGQKLIQEGDSLSSIAPFNLTQVFGPVFLSDGGDVLWYGQWDDPDTSQDTGLFLNDQLLVQEGVSLDSDGFPVRRLYPNDNGYAMSDNGAYVLVRGEQFLDGLFLITRNLFGDGFESGNTAAWSNAVP